MDRTSRIAVRQKSGIRWIDMCPRVEMVLFVPKKIRLDTPQDYQNQTEYTLETMGS